MSRIVRIVPISPTEILEEWRDVPGLEGIYRCSNLGRVRSLARVIHGIDGRNTHRPERMLKRYKQKLGYFTVYLVGLGNVYVHRLVWATFVGPIAKGFEINHIDGDKRNPSIRNLEMVTPSENMQHSYDTGLHKRGIGGYCRCCICGKRHWYSYKWERRLLNLETRMQYKCKGCSKATRYEKKCRRCGDSILDNPHRRYCIPCSKEQARENGRISKKRRRES